MTDQLDSKSAKIIYTVVDEAPALATYSLLPIIRSFTRAAGISVETRDISLAGRTIAKFSERLKEELRQTDDLDELGHLVKQPEANVIKLPCISASIPQLKATIRELQGKGYDIPEYIEEPANDEERKNKAIFDKIKGSAVNPVLREGNSDRRAPSSVKNYARNHPHSMGPWSADSLSHVSHMTHGDLRSNEKSTTVTSADAGQCRIEHVTSDGKITVLKDGINLLDGEVVDSSYMSIRALREFIAEQIADAKAKGILFSVHLKATMMKVSDPVIFGHVVSVFFRDVFEKYSDDFKKLGVNPNNGLGDLYSHLSELDELKRTEIEKDLMACYEKMPELAMVNSDKGITNLHVPSDVIIDASMPAAIRNSGKMWGRDGKAHDTKFVIPDSSYAGVYSTVIDYCKKYGAFNPVTMGSVQNVGLMAQKAEEYGSHDKTFLSPEDGTIRIVSQSGNVLLEQELEKNDIFRMCQVKDLPIQDWVKLGVNRARLSKSPAVFWLDSERAHDNQLIKKVEKYLKNYDTEGLEILIKSPAEATLYSCRRLSNGLDTISVTGNVLRDYLTDLFPILEVGTSAKMLSIVPLMNGGGLFETGAGGSAPKHVQQFQEEGHLRWDSLGEFLALAASLEHLSMKFNNPKAAVLAKSLDRATGLFLENNKSPSRKVNEIDNRGSHFYLAMYWAQELANQNEDIQLKEKFTGVATELIANELKIIDELNSSQGQVVDIGGYYKPDEILASKAMRPSLTLNKIIDL
ncbi:MAG: NADP-dependent isocitrate dehydrogenase [Deltaproteobacteria bacterium]|nr:NADP-dependent isocitrate dehydrogenase [Deltaproteobacteria bacterium]